MSDQAQFGENKGHADSTQPEPVRGDYSQSVTDAVIADMEERRRHGITKYRTELMTFNGRDALTDAYQESLDTTVYLKQTLMERDAKKDAETKGGSAGTGAASSTQDIPAPGNRLPS